MRTVACVSFAPLVEAGAKVLILGSMPGGESLRQQQYYAFERNAFWWIMGQVFSFDRTLPYAERCAKLCVAKIALWDVLKFCERTGSSDATICKEEPNDIPGLLEKLPDVRKILCNGSAAYDNLRRYFPQLESMALRLPSTSPAAALYRPEKKLELWKSALEQALNESDQCTKGS